jgi:hypothetical protein
VYKWYLPTLSEIIGQSELAPVLAGSLAQQRLIAERHWSGAVAALNTLLQQTIAAQDVEAANEAAPVATAIPMRGLVLSGPLPLLEHPELVARVSAWTFTKEPLGAATWMPLHLLPSAGQVLTTAATSTLPLLPNDPLAAEQFCLVMTAEFSVVLTLGEVSSEGKEQPAFLFSFEPEVVWQCWRSLQSRLMLTSPQVLNELETLVQQFPPVVPDYRTVMQFSRLMLAHLPQPLDWEVEPVVTRETIVPAVVLDAATSRPLVAAAVTPSASGQTAAQTQLPPARQSHSAAFDKLAQAHADVELLQAIAHEVRTPLTTIRTLTRLLLKRQDLSPDVLKRLKMIDQECTEQIDRFNLIFRAVELETAAVKHPLSPLAAISLTQVFQQNMPRWQQQASQRNLTLEVMLPQKLPLVVSDSTMLDQVLTGLFDRITHTVPPGSHIQVRVKLAGHQLKLQFQSQPQAETKSSDGRSIWTPTLKSIGQLLTFQPETGNLSLNLSVTKNLFQALGGKLTVRQRPQQCEVLTVFLPLETRKTDE